MALFGIPLSRSEAATSSTLPGIISGRGPSAARSQLAEGYGDIARNAMGLAASDRSNPSLAMRNALLAQSDAASRTNKQMATLRAQEQLNAMGLGAQYGQQLSQSLLGQIGAIGQGIAGSGAASPSGDGVATQQAAYSAHQPGGASANPYAADIAAKRQAMLGATPAAQAGVTAAGNQTRPMAFGNPVTYQPMAQSPAPTGPINWNLPLNAEVPYIDMRGMGQNATAYPGMPGNIPYYDLRPHEQNLFDTAQPAANDPYARQRQALLGGY